MITTAILICLLMTLKSTMVITNITMITIIITVNLNLT